ncbi:hypothetical protein DPMN_176744 [Dreissena polymorpha]|uniref:Uncharacterized protein n=1 Tax=Dreissena polymorpha TaxID=45954 RepID=A0A9D4E8Y8_DREPO|nr:hypothetical protein DPMN_176744 [Dreissena polymorpha]
MELRACVLLPYACAPVTVGMYPWYCTHAPCYCRHVALELRACALLLYACVPVTACMPIVTVRMYPVTELM